MILETAEWGGQVQHTSDSGAEMDLVSGRRKWAQDCSKSPAMSPRSELNHFRHRALERNRDHHVHVVRHQMTLFNLALLMFGEAPESPESSE